MTSFRLRPEHAGKIFQSNQWRRLRTARNNWRLRSEEWALIGHTGRDIYSTIVAIGPSSRGRLDSRYRMEKAMNKGDSRAAAIEM